MRTILFLLFTVIIIHAEVIDSVKVEVLAKSSKSWDGSILPFYPTGQPEVTILKVTIPPHEKLEMHKHIIINAGIMLSGELRVITEANDTLHLKAGNPIIEVVNKFHYGINEGNVPVEIVVFYAGTSGTPLSIKKN
ncbi:MAG: hypothetical protein Fur0015_10250 [Ignavibacteriales bacterium]